MSITQTSLLRHIERKLGASFHDLELNQDEIMETVIQETLPVFSSYYPNYEKITVIPERDMVDGHIGRYHLKTESEILSVSRVLVNSIEISGTMATRFSTNPFDNYINNTMLSATENPLTYEWRQPSEVELFPKGVYFSDILVEMKTVHPEHLRTIPLNLRDEFFKLALYDVQDSLYRIRRHFATINTTFVNIELFLDDLQEADSKRTELLEKWRSEYNKSGRHKKLYIY